LFITSTVTVILPSAFEANQLTSVTIGNSVTSIGDYAFNGNSSLARVTIGGNVTVGHNAFDIYGDLNTTYNNGGKKAGTYVRDARGKWARQ